MRVHPQEKLERIEKARAHYETRASRRPKQIWVNAYSDFYGVISAVPPKGASGAVPKKVKVK